jgi:hypothetical protein
MVADDGVFAERFRPEKVGFAKYTTKKTASNTKKDEYQIVDWIIAKFIVRFKESQFSGSSGIQCFEDDCCKKRADKRSPEDLSWKVCADFLRKN